MKPTDRLAADIENTAAWANRLIALVIIGVLVAAVLGIGLAIGDALADAVTSKLP